MNEFQTTLYTNLLKLTQERDAFSVKDFHQSDGSLLRIFEYRLASYTDFLQPGAMNARGTMYHVSADGTPLELLALPMEKFFGYKENPMTMKADISADNILFATNKMDGSLISTYILGGTLKLKSKVHVASREVQRATALLNSPGYEVLKDFLGRATVDGYTVDMEYTAPDNRVVLSYDKPQLSILSLRKRATGETFMLEEVCTPGEYVSLRAFQVQTYTGEELVRILAGLDDMNRFEGLVLWLKNRMRLKLKSFRYVALHKARDAVSAIERGGIKDPQKLFVCVVYEQADDLKSMFAHRQDVIDMLAAIEAEVVPSFNHMVNAVEAFFEQNKHLDAKEFSAQAQQQVKEFMSVVMPKYRGMAYDYRAFAVKNAPLFCSPELLRARKMEAVSEA